MENLIQLLSFFLIWLPLLSFVVMCFVVLVLYLFRSEDYKQKYLQSIDENERLIYSKHVLNSRMPFGKLFERKEKGVSENENK